MRFLRLASISLLVASVAVVSVLFWVRTWSLSAASEATAVIKIPLWLLLIAVPLCLLGSLIAAIRKKPGAGRCVLRSAIACITLAVFFVF